MKKPGNKSGSWSISKEIIDLMNQVFEIEKKTKQIEEDNSIEKNIRKIKDIFENDIDEDIKLIYENPIGEKYDETRTDCEASIAGESAENLVITEVIKPIIRVKKGGVSNIEQKGIVIVESKNKESKDE